MVNIIYAALLMRAQTEKTTFSCKDDYCKALHIYWSGGKRLAHWRSTHGAGHIPLWGIFIFWHACPVLTQSGNWVSKRKWVGGCGEYGIHWICMNSNKLDKFTTQSHISQEPNNGRRLYISIYHLHTYMQVPARWIIKIWVTMLGAITV